MINFNEVSNAAEIFSVSSLAHEIWNAHYLPIIGQKQIDYMLANFQSEAAITKQVQGNFKYFFAENNNQLVGYFAIVLDCDFSSTQVSKIYVSQKYQRCGIGSEMVTFIEAYCASAQHHELWLTVNRLNTQAIHFYQKVGFKKTDCLVQDIGNGFVMDDYKMVKNIKAKTSDAVTIYRTPG